MTAMPCPVSQPRSIAPRIHAQGTIRVLLLAAGSPDSWTVLRDGLRRSGASFIDLGSVIAIPGIRSDFAGSDVLRAALAEMSDMDIIGELAAPEQAARGVSGELPNGRPLAEILQHARCGWIRLALEQNWLHTVFHPIIRAGDGTVFGYEALIRARHPETGTTIGPNALFSAAHELSMEQAADQLARRCIVRDAVALRDADAKIFFNFVPPAVAAPRDWLASLLDAARQHAFSLTRIILEFAQPGPATPPDRIGPLMEFCRAHNISTAWGYPGPGVDTAVLMEQFRPDYLKFERNLVAKAENDQGVRAELKVLVDRARELGVRVIVEGVETVGQMRLAQQLGADYLQGFLFALPSNPPDMGTHGFVRPVSARPQSFTAAP